MTWKKGQSGNPGGRSKGPGALARAILAETDGGAEMYRYALKIFRDERETTQRRDAMHTWLSDRAWGKAPQTINLDGPLATAIAAPMTDDELAEAEAAIAQHEARRELH